jgi:ABC-type multidrug transport system ATPase subunit
MISFRGVRKLFEGSARPALDGVDLEVPEGTILGLVGRNGAGKSTMLRLAAGLTRPTAGSVWLAGVDLQRAKTTASRSLGWVPETPRFAPDERPGELLTHLARLDGHSPAEAERHSKMVLGRVGLSESAGARARSLSQGQTKRLALAAAWLSDPTHLLYDEVTNGLDGEGRALLAASIADARRVGSTVLLASHRLDEVEQWSDRIAVLQDGRIVTTVPGRELTDGSSRRFRIVLERPPEDRWPELRSLGTLEISDSAGVLTVESSPGHDLAADLVARGFRIRGIGSVRSDIARFLEGDPPP